MLNSTGVLFDHVNRKIIPRINVDDDAQERGWTYGGSTYTGFGINSQEHQELIEQSYKDAIKEIIKEEAKEQQKFNKLVVHASKVFFRAKSNFPFSFSP